MGRRENTFRIDFSNIPKKPDNVKIHQFCATILGLKQSDVLRIQNSRTLGVTFVKVIDLSLAQRICEEHDNKHEITVEGKNYPLRITLEEGAVEVKLYDLSEDVSDENIPDVLTRYGDVISIREQLNGADVVFSGTPTGIKIVKMIVKQNIESWITIDGEMTQVSYFGQRQTCRHCREYIHIGATCVQNKKLLVQKSYADAAKQMGTAPMPPKKTNQTNKNTIQVAPRTEKTNTNLVKSVSMLPPKSGSQPQLGPPPARTEQNFPALPSTSGSTQPSGSGSLTDTTGQQPPVNSGVVRKTVSGKSDGNDTDTSVGSTRSTRNLRVRLPGKKHLLEDEDDKREESYLPS